MTLDSSTQPSISRTSKALNRGDAGQVTITGHTGHTGPRPGGQSMQIMSGEARETRDTSETRQTRERRETRETSGTTITRKSRRTRKTRVGMEGLTRHTQRASEINTKIAIKRTIKKTGMTLLVSLFLAVNVAPLVPGSYRLAANIPGECCHSKSRF